MCSNPDNFWRQKKYDYDSLSERILSLKGKIKDISITGGEPTIHPDFPKLIKFLNREFPHIEITLVTNGRKIFYSAFAKKCLELEKLTVAVTLHGYNAKTHDAITSVKGSFMQTIGGVKNLIKYRKKGQHIEIRIVISKLTCRYVHKILSFIRKNFTAVDRVTLMFIEIEGRVNKNINTVGITYREWNDKYLSRIKPMMRYFKDLRLYHFPLCVVEPFLWKYVWRTLPKTEVAFPIQCKDCNLKGLCLGIHRGYLKYIGLSEFQPIRGNLNIKKSTNWHQPISEIKL